MIIAVLDDVPPSHLNKNEDVDSWSPSQSEEEEEEPTPKKIKQNKEKIEKPQKKNGKKEMAENK